MNPLEALEQAIEAAFMLSVDRKPGAVISRLSPEVREALAQLTSDELAKMRVNQEIVC